MSNQITKNQHYIPQSLLLHFADSEEQLFEILLFHKKIFPTNIKNTMCEQYTYEHDILPKNTIENYFSKIEGEVAPAVSDVIKAINEFKNGEIKDINEVKEKVRNILNNFLVFYYRSGALLTEFSSSDKRDKIPLLSEKILNSEYINNLANVIDEFYDFAIIESSDDFLLSDQFVSTTALRIKTQFSNLSNRHIGLKETAIFMPISASFYIVYWNTQYDFPIKKNEINKLSEENIKLINSTIINNSYTKCVAKKKERIEEVVAFYKWASPTNFFAGGNPSGYFTGATKKKEVFFFEEERKAYEILENLAMIIYRNLGRNDPCSCKSGKKFKKCHWDAYNRFQSVMLTFGRTQRENMRDFLIYKIPITEKPIDEWSGYHRE